MASLLGLEPSQMLKFKVKTSSKKFFKKYPIDKFRKLQLNLIRSHATGYGPHLEPSMARMLLALRINVLAKGHSGISLENVEKLVKAFNGWFK